MNIKSFQNVRLPEFVNNAVEALPQGQYNLGVRDREVIGQRLQRECKTDKCIIPVAVNCLITAAVNCLITAKKRLNPMERD